MARIRQGGGSENWHTRHSNFVKGIESLKEKLRQNPVVWSEPCVKMKVGGH